MTKWGMLIDLKRCAGCGACVVACQLQNNQSPGVSWVKLDVAEWGEAVDDAGRVYIPHACMHCENPQCVAVCPTGASQKQEDGVVTVDYESCIDCGQCIIACPYGARASNNSTKNYFDAPEKAPYEAYGVQRTNVVEKCIFCRERVAEGLNTACTSNCPAKARFFGDLDDPTSDISKRLTETDCIRIDDTSFYFSTPANMDQKLLPFAASKNEYVETKKAAPGIDPVVATAGVIGVAAIGVGVGVGIKKSKDKKAKETSQQNTQDPETKN